MPSVEYQLLPKQRQFVLNDAKQCLYSGAFGAGKSFSLCVKLVCRASKPRAREALVRKTLSDLKGTTLRTLLLGDGDTPPVLPLGSYTHNKSERLIKIHGGGEIVYFSMEDSSTIGSYNLTGAAVDQAEELTDDDWFFLLGRLRATGEGITRQLYAVCNPDSPSHHLAQRFGLAPDSLVPAEGCWVVTTSSADNPHLPPDYLSVLNSFTGVRRKRYVQGLWAGAEGVVYESWDRSKHVRQVSYHESEVSRVIIGVDDGTTVPFSALRCVVLRSGRKFIERITYRRGMLMQDKVDAVAEMAPFDVVIVDPAASSLKLHLRNEGFAVRDADNDVLAGIQEVQTQLSMAPDGMPWLIVSPSCGDLVREMETYEWKVRKGSSSAEVQRDEPVKENDHAVDALRYLCMEDRLPASVAVDRAATKRMSDDLPEDRKPRHQLFVGPKIGWGAVAESKVREGDSKLFIAEDTDAKWPGMGKVSMWCDLPGDRPSQDRAWVIAASVGTGAPGSMSVIKVGDPETRTVVAECVMMSSPPSAVARTAVALGMWFGGIEKQARLIWNHVGGGIGFGETVRQLMYRNVYHNVVEGTVTGEPGWRYTPSGMLALLSNLQGELREGRYKEATAATITDLQRWAYGPDGTVAPVSATAEGESSKNASDRALAAMLLAHAFKWVARMPPKELKPQVRSVMWYEERDKSRPTRRR